MRGRSAEAGFSMMEVLVAVFVLSVGILGVASLQTAALRSTQSAHQRSVATFFAGDMADRMRANSAGVAAGAYDDINGIPADPACIDTDCTPAQMAQYDAFDWGTDISQALPSGHGTVADAGGGLFTISVMWDERRTGVTGTDCDPSDPDDLVCFQVTVRP